MRTWRVADHVSQTVVRWNATLSVARKPLVVLALICSASSLCCRIGVWSSVAAVRRVLPVRHAVSVTETNRDHQCHPVKDLSASAASLIHIRVVRKEGPQMEDSPLQGRSVAKTESTRHPGAGVIAMFANLVMVSQLAISKTPQSKRSLAGGAAIHKPTCPVLRHRRYCPANAKEQHDHSDIGAVLSPPARNI